MEHIGIDTQPNLKESEFAKTKTKQEQLYDLAGFSMEAVTAKLEKLKQVGVFEHLDKESQHDFLLWLGSSDSIKNLEKLDFTGKKILTVAGSGEFFQSFIDRGSKQVDVFDYSMFACFFNELKLIAARELSYQEYINFFKTIAERKVRTIIDIDEAVIVRLNPFLSSQARIFLKQIATPEYWKLLNPDFTESPISIRHIAVNHANDINFLASEKNYKIMQERLRHSNVNFRITNINSPDINAQNYDYVYISNISFGHQVEIATQLLNKGAKCVGFTFGGSIDLPIGGDYYLAVDTETGEIFSQRNNAYDTRHEKKHLRQWHIYMKTEIEHFLLRAHLLYTMVFA